MAFGTLFRFSMYSVRLFQICALALTMFGVYYSSWLRKSHDLATSNEGNGLEYPTLNETLFIFTVIGRATIGAGLVTWATTVVYVLFAVIDYAETVKGIETELSRDGRRSFWQSEKPKAHFILV
ncbi:hypothetical protein CKAH01_07777 [Colletotrichum kahawae]|uniref:Uncharacterized protein n=1 Tax=Colletotrichum kahawae TaxID=34407 RepID=A0AAE0D0J7_COLKA|nr:hypothetical protein CKAH01_07777 [Colletotrichum kahawae]